MIRSADCNGHSLVRIISVSCIFVSLYILSLKFALRLIFAGIKGYSDPLQCQHCYVSRAFPTHQSISLHSNFPDLDHRLTIDEIPNRPTNFMGKTPVSFQVNI